MATSVGVDVGGTKILAIAVEDTGRRVGKEVRRPTPHGTTALLDAIVGVVSEVHASAGEIDAVGLGIPGLGRLAREAAEAGRGRRLIELAGGDVEDVRGEHVTRAAMEGDVEALEVFREFGWWAALASPTSSTSSIPRSSSSVGDSWKQAR